MEVPQPPLALLLDREAGDSEGLGVAKPRFRTMLAVSEMTSSNAREHFSEALATANREPVFITRHGKRVAALVTAEFYERAIEGP